jgi:7-cyano-7-deazaguanine synthase
MPRHTTPTFKAIVLLSGGLDSAYNLSIASVRYSSLLALTFDYGQRAAKPEIKAARALAAFVGGAHKVVRLPWLRELAPAPMTTAGGTLPSRPGRVESVWVPNRNGVFVAIGAAFAEKYRAPILIAGFNAEEAADFPDNSAAFLNAANRALQFSTAGRVKLVSYSTHLDKQTIAKKAAALSVPLEKIYPCYTEGPVPCGGCISCRRTAQALRRAGLTDILPNIFGSDVNR